jgi:hypothetical protein
MNDVKLAVLFFDRHSIMWAFIDELNYLCGVGCTNWRSKNGHVSTYCAIGNGFDQSLQIRSFDHKTTRPAVRYFCTSGILVNNGNKINVDTSYRSERPIAAIS